MMDQSSAGPLPMLLTSAEVARVLKVDRSTLCHWRARGLGPRVVWVTPRAPRYRSDEVLAWIERISS